MKIIRIFFIAGLLIFLTLNSFSQADYTPRDVIITGLAGGGEMNNLSISPIDHRLMMVTSNMTGAYISVNGLKDFRMIHHTQLLNVSNSRACFHPKDIDSIFASSANGLKVSSDRGITWNNVGNIGKIEYGLAIHPVNTRLMLAGSAAKVYRSLNAGVTWTQVNGPTGTILGFHFDRTSSDAGGVCFAATSGGVWRSDDGGDTWVKKVNGLPAASLVTFAGASNKTQSSVILYCGIGSSIYRSTDRGENWTLLSSITGTSSFLLASDANPLIVYAVLGGSTIRKSTNGGDTWSSGLYYPKMSDANFNLEHNYFTSWMQQNASGTLFSAAIAPNNPNLIAFTNSMVLMYTEDGGITWKSAHSKAVIKPGEPIPKSFQTTGLANTTTWHYYVDPFEQNRQYICYTDIGFARSVDAGESWLFWPYWGPDKTMPFDWVFNLYEIAFDPEIPGKMWGAFSRVHDIPNNNAIVSDHVTKFPENERYGGIGFSSDFAANWDDAGYNTGLPNRAVISVIVDPSSPKNSRTLYAAVYEVGVFKSTDDGKNWTKKSTGLGSAVNMQVVRLQLHKDTLFCLVTGIKGFTADGVGLYRSVNGAESWEKVNAAKDILWPRDFAVNPNNTKEIFIGARATPSPSNQAGALWRTTDGGANWTAIANKGNHFGAYLHPSRPGWIYMTLCEGGSGAGLWLSKDNGASWLPYSKIPHRWIQRVDFDFRNPDVIYISTFGSSAMKAPADPEGQLPSGQKYLDVDKQIHIYPNPCSDFIRINNLTSSQKVDYKIYDITGVLRAEGAVWAEEVIPISLERGIYILSAKMHDGLVNGKFSVL
jgi:photosystem II stability/assembly factor-like uncharacterized protein